jgi:NADH:ubiquinone oxidoreductase subunit K
LVLNFALLVGACPYRLALRFGYGDLVAFIVILSIAGGVAVGVGLLLYIMKRRDI